MKILATGDWHLTSSIPENRKEDFCELQKGKVAEVLKIAQINECHCIVQPGDMFDGVGRDWELVQYYMSLLKRYQHPQIYTIPGQHDLRYHSITAYNNTPMAVMESSKVVEVLRPPNKPRLIWDNVMLYGCAWGEEIPKPDTSKKCVNVLVMHKMVIEGDKVWEGQEDYILAKPFLARRGFDIVISGDNHQSFFASSMGKMLVNCGSLMRTRIDQQNHAPCVWVIDTDNLIESQQIFLHIKPASEVFKLEKTEAEKKRNEELEAFVRALGPEVALEGLDFVRNLWDEVKRSKVDEGVVEILKEALGGHQWRDEN